MLSLGKKPSDKDQDHLLIRNMRLLSKLSSQILNGSLDTKDIKI